MKMFMSTNAKYEIVLVLMLVMLSDIYISRGYMNMENTTYPSISIHMKEEDKGSPGGDDRRDG
jgi:hypothetical protein